MMGPNYFAMIAIGALALFMGAAIRGGGAYGALVVLLVSVLPAALGYLAGLSDGARRP